MTLAPVARVLDALGVRFALIGAHALAVRGYPRFTADIDLLTTDTRVLNPEVWAAVAREGGTVDPRRGDSDDPLAGVVQRRGLWWNTGSKAYSESLWHTFRARGTS